MAHAPKQLILGLLADLSLEKARPFFLSLEKSGYQGDLCLFVNGLAADLRDFLRARRINVVPFQPAYLKPKWARLSGLARPFLTRERFQKLETQLGLAYMHPHCARHAYYLAYLAECGADYDHVMLTDIRDVLFQMNPFSFALPDGLAVFSEDPSLTIGNSSHASVWIRHGYGQAVLDKLRDKPIFCAGTIFGTPAAIRDYCARALRLFQARKTRWTIDQATFNYILHLQPPPNVHRFDNDAGPVLTLGGVDPARLRFNAAGRLVNPAGSVYNTLHQYDRHPQLAQQLIQLLT
ncbi:MAG: hypothetical protein P4N60_04785 [Verrucomicrobiae bacterium]|nr:hypothetical protein [Verrucomicrobiae bacterium]